MADGTLIFDTKIDNSGVKKSLQDIKKQVNSMGNTVREFQLVITPTIKAKIEKDAIKQAVQATNEQLKNAYATSGLSMNMTPKLDLSKIEPNIQKLTEMLTPLADVITRAFPTASIENFTNALRNLSTQSIDFSALKTQIQGFTDMLTPLSSQLSTAFSGEGFTQLNTIVNSINQLAGSITAMRTTLDGMGTAMTTAFNVQAVQGFSEAFKSIDINLVTTQAEKLKTALEPLANTMQQAFNTEHITACAGAIERLSNAVSGLSENTNLPRLSEPIQQTSENLERSQKGISKFRDTGLSAVNSLAKSFSRLENIVRSVFSTAVVVNFGKQAVQTASQLSNAMTGLKSIVDGQGRSYSTANKFIQDYISDGLVPLQNAVTAYKNLASRGYSDEQIQKVMESLKNSATYGRQASLTIGDAVQSATEGIKNENSILVDNAGVTKNVSVMWKEYAQSIGKSYTELTRQEKIQAEVNGIIEETKFQMGDAEKASSTFMGQNAKLSASFTNLKVAIGNTIIPALQRIIPVINSVVQKLTEFFTKMALYSELFFGIKKASDTATAGTDKAVSSTNALADAQENVADATADAKKELMGFDEINKLEINSDNNLGKEEKTDTQLPLATGDFSEANTITDTIKENIDKINDKLSELWKVLEPFRTFVAKGFEDFYNSFLKPLGKWTIGKGLPQLEKIFKNLMKNTDFSKLNKALDNLWKALEPLAETVGEGLLWFLENILSPLASWTISDVIPAFLNVFSGCIKVLNGILKAFEPLGNWLWDNFLKPLAKWTGEIVTSGLEALANVLGKIGDWVLKHSGATGVIIGMSIAIIGLNTACKLLASGALLTLIGNIGLLVKALGGISVTIGVVIAGIVSWTYVITTLKENWSDIMDVIEQEGGIWGFLSGWIDDCSESIENFFSSSKTGEAWFKFWEKIGTWFADEFPNLLQSWEDFWRNVGETTADFVSNSAKELIEGLKEKLTAVKEWFKGLIDWIRNFLGIHSPSTLFKEFGQYIIEGLVEGFEAIGHKVTEFFGDLWSSVQNVFSGVNQWFCEKFNSAVTGIKNAFGTLKDFFGNVYQGIKDVFSGIPDWFKAKFSDAWQNVKDVFSSGGQVFSGIKEGIAETFRSIVNSLIDGINVVISMPFNKINEMLNSIKYMEILGHYPFYDLWGDYPLQVPQIPKLAKGGLAYQPTLAMIGDNRNARTDPEVVAPLSKLQGMMGNSDNTQVLLLLTEILNALNNQKSEITLDNRIFGELVRRTQTTQNKRSGGLA